MILSPDSPGGALEFLMDRVIGKLAAFEPEDPRSAILTAHMSWPQKMDVLESLVNALVRDFPHLARFDALKPLLKKAQEGRNRIVHGQWGYENGVVTKLRLTARGELKFSNDPITISDIQTIALDIGQAGLDLLKFVLNK